MEYMPINNQYRIDQTNKLIGQGCVTNSKHPDRFVKGVYPTHVMRGRDCYLFTEDNRKYIDFICGLGTNLFGYGNDNIVSHKLKYSYMGDCLSLPSVYEAEAASALLTIVPWAEKVKFLNDGSSACHAAIIMAKAYAQKVWDRIKYKVYSSGYHGWHSEFTAMTPPAYGCSDIIGNIHKLPANLSDIDKDYTAAIIVEPVELDDSKERITYLKELREFCDKNKIVLIFDEIITGMRYPKFSVANYYNIHPDLILMSKAIANGAKIAAVCGKKEILDGEYFVSGTFHGEQSSLHALIATTIEARTKPNEYDMATLREQSRFFCERFNEIFKDVGVRLSGWGSRAAFSGHEINKAIIWQECIKAGYLFGPSLFTNKYLVQHFDEIIYFWQQIAQLFKLGKVKLQGQLPTSPFSAKVRQQ